MILTLEVIGEQAEDLGPGSRKVFDSIGGTIGRLPDNDWVFPDPYVSGRHALIRYLNGQFFVEDTSTNGVFINTPDNRLPRAQAHLLKHGDLLFIDAYRIQVSIEKPVTAKAGIDDPLELLKGHARGTRHDETVAMSPRIEPRRAETPREFVAEDRTENMARKGEDLSVEWFGLTDMQAPAAAPARSPIPEPAVSKSVAAASKSSASPAQRKGSSTPPAHAREVSPKKPSPSAVSGPSLKELIEAAGIQGVEPSAELAQTLGAVLRVATGGLMEALRARERAKDDMRLRGTSFKAQDNNPLKFSANVDDAFHNMLVKENAAYLTPPEAFDDALRDVRDHQAALAAAMRLAFESVLAQFDPNRLQDEFDRQMKKGSILGVPAKLRYWDLYRERYESMIKDGAANFRTLFGEEFAKAYEDHLNRLHANARKRTK